MTTHAQVIGIGQAAAGDDGVGLAVLEELRKRALPPNVCLRALAHPVELVTLLDDDALVVIVDAVLASPAGAVFEVEPDAVSTAGPRPASSHGFGTAQALELALTLRPAAKRRVRLLAIAITNVARYQGGLSPAVAAAVPVAADRVITMLTLQR